MEMSFWVKRGYTISYLGRPLWVKMLRHNIVSKDSSLCYVLVCDGVKMNWGNKFRDYNIRDGVDVLPALTVVLRRVGE